MDDLQFKIASTICAHSTLSSGKAVTIADHILALIKADPEIKAGLALLDVRRAEEGRWPDDPLPNLGHSISTNTVK